MTWSQTSRQHRVVYEARLLRQRVSWVQFVALESVKTRAVPAWKPPGGAQSKAEHRGAIGVKQIVLPVVSAVRDLARRLAILMDLLNKGV